MIFLSSKINELNRLLFFNQESDIDAALIISNINRRYFTGFNSSEGILLITREKNYLLLDFRYIEAAKNQVVGLDVVLFSKIEDTLIDILNTNNISLVAFENESITLKDANFFEGILKKAKIESIFDKQLDYQIKSLRIIKSEKEIGLIKESQQISEKAYNKALESIRPGVSEKDIALEIEFFMKKNGAENIAFEFIVVSGKNSSLPHGVPSEKRLKYQDFVTIDIGCVFNGYNSDMTRTICIGKATDEQKKVYNTVLEAQIKAINGVGPGIPCFEIDKLARDYIYNSGYEGCFGHSTGHGVGMQVHENPTVSSSSNTILKKGMVITVEPGIYLNNCFGVRIEDMIIVKENGYENITSIDKNLLEL